MQRTIESTGSVTRLEQAIAAAQPNHEDIKLVKHGESKAFALVSIPDYMANALDCGVRRRGEPVKYNARQKTYGKYYAIGLRLAKAGEDSGVLWAIWAQESGAWKVVSYTVLNP